MTYDTLTMTAVAGELQKLVGARVQRIIQPSREEIVLLLYHAGEEFGLLLSSHPHHARVHLTRRRYRRPEQPPPFCMLLRKYLTGARISAVFQPHLERILMLHFEAHEGLPPVKLIAEIMGRRSNLLLVDHDGIILGAVKTATREQNPRRAVMPGLPYEEVPPQPKLDPSAAGTEALAAAMLPLLAKGSSPEEALLKTVCGISPLAARELIYRSGWHEEAPRGSIGRLGREVKELFNGSGAQEACLLPELNIYASYPLTHLQDAAVHKFAKMNELLDHFYGNLGEAEERRILQGQLRSRVNRRKSRLEQKLKQLQEELLQAGEADRYRIYGETLLTYATMISRGASEATLPDLYHPEETITIPLDPSLGAGGNAQKYFRIYRKVSNSRKHLKKQIRRLREELAYCRELLYTIERGGHASLTEIREELVEAGYMKPDFKGSLRQKRKRRQETPQPLSFMASSGSKILVGQNNRQNDYLTFKIAARRDTWLHAQGLPGSHVIIKGAAGPPAESDLHEAALLAAHYSRGRDLSAVAVDYTEVRHLRRAPGGKPGFVLYDHFKTITVNPRDEKVKPLLEQRN
jgi:predicted ribosome quality control (RQC) complex YloA/Tae2 family protein